MLSRIQRTPASKSETSIFCGFGMNKEISFEWSMALVYAEPFPSDPILKPFAWYSITFLVAFLDLWDLQ